LARGVEECTWGGGGQSNHPRRGLFQEKGKEGRPNKKDETLEFIRFREGKKRF